MNTRTPSGLGSKAACAGILASVLFASRGVAQTPPIYPTPLQTAFELQDGAGEDIAGPTDATTGVYADKRVWVAQGRVRAAIQVSTGNRMHNEDRVFHDVDPITPRNERLIAVEFDEVHSRLYTLTESALYAETISGGVPISSISAPLTATGMTVDPPTDLKLWPEDKKVFVLTQRTLDVWDDTGSALVFQSSARELADEPSPKFLRDTLTPHEIDELKVALYDSVTIYQDVDPLGFPNVMACVRARMGGYGGKPSPRCMLLCDLDSQNSYTTPAFNKLGTGGKQYVFWNPVPCSPAGGYFCNGLRSFDYSIDDLDIVTTGTGARIAYVGCQKAGQVRTLDLTDAFTSTAGIVVSVNPIVIDAAEAIQRIRVDPSNTNRFFACTDHNFHIHNTSTNQDYTYPVGMRERFTTDIEGLNNSLVMKMPGHSLTAWTESAFDADYQIKVFDWAADAVPPPPLLERFQMHKCDGGVALPSADAIYLPTISGVVRYEKDPSTGAWRALDSSYRTNESSPGAADASITEHIAIGAATPVGANRLVTASARGGFDEFVLDASNNPGPVTRYYPPTATPTYPGHPPFSSSDPYWLDSHTYYGNDVAFVTIGSQNFVLADVANLTLKQGGLSAYGWTGTQWQYLSTVTWITGFTPNGIATELLTDVIHVDTSNATPFAFVTDAAGFTVIDLSQLPTSTHKMTVADRKFLQDQYKQCRGITTSISTIFVCLYGNISPSDPGSKMKMFKWDVASGLVLQEYAGVTSFDVENAPANAANWGPTYRCRFLPTDPTSGCGLVYVCTDAYLLEFGYTPPVPHQLPPVLAYRTYWRSAYTNHIQDAQPYVFSGVQRILVSKDSETFAIVTPSTTSCP